MGCKRFWCPLQHLQHLQHVWLQLNVCIKQEASSSRNLEILLLKVWFEKEITQWNKYNTYFQRKLTLCLKTGWWNKCSNIFRFIGVFVTTNEVKLKLNILCLTIKNIQNNEIDLVNTVIAQKWHNVLSSMTSIVFHSRNR